MIRLAIRQIVQIISRRIVPICPKVFTGAAVNHPDFGFFAVLPANVIRIGAAFNILNGIPFLAWRPPLAVGAQARNVAIPILARMGYSSSCHALELLIQQVSGVMFLLITLMA